MTVWLKTSTREKPAEGLLTVRQRVFAAGLRKHLSTMGVEFDEQMESADDEAWYTFHIKTPPESCLDVKISVIDDVFEFTVNGASLRRDRTAWKKDLDSSWIDECLRIVDALLRNELKVRVRQTLVGGKAGAIWLPNGSGDGKWDGDIVACLGRGHLHVVPDWWCKRDTTA